MPDSKAPPKKKHFNLSVILTGQTSQQKGNICCGILVNLMFYGPGITMLVIGVVKSLDDLIIVGSIFTTGGIVFTIVLIVSNCTTYFKDRKIHAKLEQDVDDIGVSGNGKKVDPYNVSTVRIPRDNESTAETVESDDIRTHSKVHFY